MGYRLGVLEQVQEVERIESDWRALVGPSGHALSEPEWYIAAVRARLRARMQTAVLALWRGGELVAVAPLARDSRGRRYEILGSSALFEPAELLARDDDSRQQLAAAIVNLRRPVLLSRIPLGGMLANELGIQARGKGLLLALKSADSPYVDLSSGWSTYYNALPSRIRNILRRASRSLARQGRVAYDFIRPVPSAVPSLLEDAFRVELQSWKGRAGSAVLQREGLHRFFMEYGQASAVRAELLISFLRLDGRPIAMQIASIGRNSYRQLKIGYDDRQSKYLPGLQLLLETIRWSSNEGLASYEFMGSREPWTYDWAALGREHTTLSYYPYNVHGFVAFLSDGLGRVRGRLRRGRTTAAASRTRP